MSYKSYLMNWRVKKIFESKVLAQKSLSLSKKEAETVFDQNETKVPTDDLKRENTDDLKSVNTDDLKSVNTERNKETGFTKYMETLKNTAKFEIKEDSTKYEISVDLMKREHNSYDLDLKEEQVNFKESSSCIESSVKNLNSLGETTKKTNEETQKKFTELLTHFKVLTTKKENVVTEKNDSLKKDFRNIKLAYSENISSRTFDFAYLRHKWEIISNK